MKIFPRYTKSIGQKRKYKSLTLDQKNRIAILDPAYGTAGFLISAYKPILDSNQDSPLPLDKTQRLTCNIVGYDIEPSMVHLSLVNMYLHKFPNPNIYEYDTLPS